MLELQQTWYHFYDRAKSGEREINQVLDFFTNEQFIYLDLLDNGFAELKILGRNLNQEMAFIERNGAIIVNLGNLKEFPLAGKYSINPKYHVKMQINYLEKNAEFNYFKTPRTGYETSFSIKGKLQPEFTINIPNGMYINPINVEGKLEYLRADLHTAIEIESGSFYNDSFENSFKLYKSKEWKEVTFYSFKIDEIFYLRFIKTFSNNNDDYKLIFGVNLSIRPLDFDHSRFDNGLNESYKFIIKPESYKIILKTPEYCLNSIDLGYTVKNNLYYLIFPGIGFSLVASLCIFIILGDFKANNINMSVPLSCLIVTLSYLGLFLEFSIFKKYEIIYKNFVSLMIGILLFLTFLIFLFVISPEIKNLLRGLIIAYLVFWMQLFSICTKLYISV